MNNFKNPINLNAKEPLENPSKNVLLILVIVLLIIGALTAIYFLRDKIFKKGKTLGTNVTYQKEQGYGTYGDPVYGPCLTTSNSCLDTGSQTVTQKCIPNPVSGLGCIDSNGEQTFNDLISNQNCNPICRSFILTQNDNFTSDDPQYFTNCQYIDPYSNDALWPCIPNTTIEGYVTTTYTCTNNDDTGVNECSYKCADIGPKIPGQSVLQPGQNIPFEEQPDSFYYIPACDPKLATKGNPKTKSFTLNSFPWEIAFNLPANGITISKGFTIKNNYNPDGSIDLNTFNIDPPYKPPRGLPVINPNLNGTTSTITLTQLKDLDNNVYTFGACSVNNPKTVCGNQYYYNPTDIESGLTSGTGGSALTAVPPNPIIDPSIGNISRLRRTKNCFNYPYYDNSASFINPVYNPNYPNSTYKPEGIGSLGYAMDKLVCSPNVPSLLGAQVPGTLNYTIPSAPVGAVCKPFDSQKPDPGTLGPNLNLIEPGICLKADPTSMYVEQYGSITSTSNSKGLYNLQNLPGSLNADHSGYLADPKLVFNSCKTIYPEVNNIDSIPSVISSCLYMPDNSVIDFTEYPDTPQEIRDLIGVFVQFNLTNFSPPASEDFFMTLLSTPCDCDPTVQNCADSSEILQTPFGYCQGSTDIYAGSIPIIAVPTKGVDAANYWNRKGCDAEMISAVNSIEMVISPRSAVSDGTGDILCDIYVYFGNTYYGYLTYTYQYDSLGNLYAQLAFQPLTQGNAAQINYTCIDNNCNTSQLYPKFRLGYNSSGYYLAASNPAYSIPSASNYDIYIAMEIYDGINPTSNTNIGRLLKNSYSGIYGLAFYITPQTTSFQNISYIKTSGLYVGKNVGNIISNQKSVPCYKSGCDPKGTEPCFQNTCNLFYANIPEICK